jgi:hypothetical protein
MDRAFSLNQNVEETNANPVSIMVNCTADLKRYSNCCRYDSGIIETEILQKIVFSCISDWTMDRK